MWSRSELVTNGTIDATTVSSTPTLIAAIASFCLWVMLDFTVVMRCAFCMAFTPFEVESALVAKIRSRRRRLRDVLGEGVVSDQARTARRCGFERTRCRGRSGV